MEKRVLTYAASLHEKANEGRIQLIFNESGTDIQKFEFAAKDISKFHSMLILLGSGPNVFWNGTFLFRKPINVGDINHLLQ